MTKHGYTYDLNGQAQHISAKEAGAHPREALASMLPARRNGRCNRCLFGWVRLVDGVITMTITDPRDE